MSQYKELADKLEWLAEGYWEAEIRKAIAILRGLDAQKPVGYWGGAFSGDGGADLYEVEQVSAFGRVYKNLPLYAAPVAPQSLDAQPVGEIRRHALSCSEVVWGNIKTADLPHGTKLYAALFPIDMVLFCPKCGMQHIDAPEAIDQYPTPEKDAAHWTNPPHRSHLCHGCGHIWRPADVPTNGVQAVKTAGKADSPIAAPVAAQPQQAKPEPLTADDLKEPKNGKQWRVEWWNESCRMMLPAGSKLDGFVSYKNGTLQFTIKKTDHSIKAQG